VKLLDTNVIVYARDSNSPFHQWAKQQLAGLVSSEGAGLSTASLAELCAQDGVKSADVPREIIALGVHLLDIPAASAPQCGAAYRAYRLNRKRLTGQGAPKIPLPDFFIVAHAEFLGMDIVTNDAKRFQTYFPKVKLVTP
jgi:predicted nucleic acid-binding protein